MTSQLEPATAIRVKTRMAAAALAAIAGLLLGGTAMAGNPGNPATLGVTASVEIFTPITITEDAKLDFGTIVRPTSGFVDYVVSEVDGTIDVSDNSASALGGHARGQYDITGDTGEAYILTVTANGCTHASLQLLSVVSDVVPPLFLPNLDIQIGGKLRVASSVVPGGYLCDYVIEAKY